MSQEQRRPAMSLLAATFIVVGTIALRDPLSAPARVISSVKSQTTSPYTHVTSLRLPPTVLGQTGVALAPSGRMFIADARLRRVHVIDADGTEQPPLVFDDTDRYHPASIYRDPASDLLTIIWQEGFDSPASRYLDVRDLAGVSVRPMVGFTLEEHTIQAIARHGPTSDLYVALPRLLLKYRDNEGDLGETIPLDIEVGYPFVGPYITGLSISGDRIAVLSEGFVSIHDLDGSRIVKVDTERRVAAIASNPSENGFVMMLSSEGRELVPDESLLLGIDVDGERVPIRDLTSGEVGINVPADIRWPKSVALAGSHVAAIGAVPGNNWAVRRSGPNPITVFGIDPDVYELPVVGEPTPPPLGAVAIASSSSGVVVAGCTVGQDEEIHTTGDCQLYPAAAYRIEATEGTGRITNGRLLDRGLLDVALNDEDEAFVSHADFVDARDRESAVFKAGHITRLAEGIGDDSWDEACDCPYGGRLAAESNRLLVTRPRTREIVSFDASSGALLGGAIRTDEEYGAWPSDIADLDIGGLLTSHAGERRIKRLGADGAVLTEWATLADVRRAPWRIAHGAWNGREIVASVAAGGRILGYAAEDGTLLFDWAPRRADETALDPVDLAIDKNQQLLIVDGSGSIEIFESSPTTWEPPTPTPALPVAAPCDVSATKNIGRPWIVLGDTVNITMNFRADCLAAPVGTEPEIDIVMVFIGRKRTIETFDMKSLKDLKTWFQLIDSVSTRVGAVLGNGEDGPAVLPMRSDLVDLVDDLIGYPEWRGQDIVASVERATEILRLEGRPDALPVIVLFDMFDSPITRDREDALLAGQAARAAGIQTYAVISSDVAYRSSQFAGIERHVAIDASQRSLATILESMQQAASPTGITELTIEDTLGEWVFYEEGSARPPAIEGLGIPDLRWTAASLPGAGITLQYRVRPLTTGTIATSVRAIARFTDADGSLREVVFPGADVEVLVPTITPTATPNIRSVFIGLVLDEARPLTAVPEPSLTPRSTGTARPTSSPTPLITGTAPPTLTPRPTRLPPVDPTATPTSTPSRTPTVRGAW